MACDYNVMKKWGKILTIFASLIMIALGIARFFNIINIMNPIDYIANLYMIGFGVLFILCEIRIKIILAKFNFIRFFFGKAFFCLFLGLFCFNSHNWFTITVGVIFWIISVINLILGIIYCGDEKSCYHNIESSNNVKKVNEVQIQSSKDEKPKGDIAT